MPPAVILLGLRGAGKSTLGRRAAAILGVPFQDLDDLLAARLRVPRVADALRSLGEPAFRVAECDALRDALAVDTGVLALGGGTPTHLPSRDLLAPLSERLGGHSIILYLHAAPAVLRERLSRTDLSARPALVGPDPLSEIDALYAQRDAAYRELADGVLETQPLAAGFDDPAATDGPEQHQEALARTIARLHLARL